MWCDLKTLLFNVFQKIHLGSSTYMYVSSVKPRRGLGLVVEAVLEGVLELRLRGRQLRDEVRRRCGRLRAGQVQLRVKEVPAAASSQISLGPEKQNYPIPGSLRGNSQ